MSIPGRPLDPYLSQQEEHQRLDWIGQMELTVILDGTITGGQLSVVEGRAGRGDASPVHVHTHDDEAFLLLEGAMTVWVGDQRVELLPGGIGFLPKSIPHAFRFDAPSRALILTTPAGQEDFFRAAGWDLSKPKPQGWAISIEALQSAAAAVGTQMVGPPHGLEE
ncbi:MAG TPA: cupin domain-containing protein [Acidimicrobiales bacterium]|nr:cupin domain-containing protein [Acidimicrobiales bacterium]